MKRTHALAISLLVAVAVVAGGFAAFRTTGLASPAQAATTSPDAAVAAKQAQLDELEQSIRRALARRPPELPPLAEREQAAQVASGDIPAPGTARADDDRYEPDGESEREGGDDRYASDPESDREGGEDD